MPPKVDQFLRRRETTLLQIKAIETYANNLTGTEDIEPVKARLETLQRLMTSFTNAEDEIFARDGEAHSNAVECDEIYYTAIAKLNAHLNRMLQKTPNFDATATLNNGTLNQTRCDIKLPRLTLPTFDGNYQEWQSYHDMFVSTVHDNPGLTDVQRLQYLKDSLRGEARASLRYLAITEANYIEAYQKLTKRYSKKKLILNSFIKTFISQPSVTQATGKQLRQICDTSDEVIRGIRALGNPAIGRDPWLIYLILNKLDEDTQQRWASETSETDFPTWQSFLDFVTKRADALENCQLPSRKPQPRSTNIHSHAVAVRNCPLCNTIHNLYQCAKFKEMDITARREFMQKANRCFNCLCDSHLVSRCQSKRSCMKCHKRHNTLLHLPTNHDVAATHTRTNANIEEVAPNNSDKTPVHLTTATTMHTYQSQRPTFNAGLLQTALVDIRGANDSFYTCRALLDSGSLVSFITESCVQKLGLPRKNQRIIVEGLGSTKVGTSRGRVNIELYSRTRKDTSFHVDSLILSSITSYQPQIRIADYHWAEFQNLPLADPTFQEPGEIEILIGCDHYLSLLLPGHIESINSNLVAQETTLGWIISGTLRNNQSPQVTNLCTSIDIDEALTKFWEIEEIKPPTRQTKEEIYCEDHFVDNYKQNSDGRYVVALPFDPKAASLGESKSQAVRRLQSTERRFERDPDLKREYISFMREYEKLGHMERISDTEIDTPWDKSYYLPHHSVSKETSTTTRVRVVFDASAKTKTGSSLNDNLCVGPSIQQTLQQILLRFRFHRFVMTADLEKMFRQILITKNHTNFQRILWRDDPLPRDILDDWSNFRKQLPLIESITIPRWLKFTSNHINLLGFSDASKSAYAAVIYAACTNKDGKMEVTIISAKTKVAPAQKQITIPKLELCAALLLAKLMDSVRELLSDRETSVYMWTDSTIVLQWLETLPRSLEVFVGNRVGEITTNYPRKYWYHISTSQNPADCASRGILPSELPNHKLWWTGPEWLKLPVSEWPIKFQPTITCNLISVPSVIDLIVVHNSNFNKIIRVLAYCQRFIKNCKLKPHERRKSFLSCIELSDSKLILIKYVQEKHFHTEIKILKDNFPLPKTHKLINLNPFLDKNGIFRVGGRIDRAVVSFDMRHPIILPNEDIVTEMLVRTTHEALLCGNHALLFTTLKQNFWIINCKTIIRRVIKKCIRCFRYTSKIIQPMMADLPTNRVTLVRPFMSTGVDYAGPIYVRPSKRRGLKPDKSYIAVFVCLSTRAIHLELAGDLSTDTFIGAFRRFISRRGLCREIISDNGSNFIGAKAELNDLFKVVTNSEISNFLSQNQICWKLNPPSGSHFGGIYEAAVKSTKYHLKRVLSEALLTYEEMATLLAQIESILNSRPLCVNSDDDLNPLTPAHFLIGHPYTYLPDPDISQLKLSHLSRWQYLQRLRQEFWKKWHLSYLTSLQKRTKWQTNSSDIKTDDIVLIHDTNLPPSKWKLGRVLSLHPGADNIVRVVTLKTASGTCKRPVVKLSILPIND